MDLSRQQPGQDHQRLARGIVAKFAGPSLTKASPASTEPSSTAVQPNGCTLIPRSARLTSRADRGGTEVPLPIIISRNFVVHDAARTHLALVFRSRLDVVECTSISPRHVRSPDAFCSLECHNAHIITRFVTRTLCQRLGYVLERRAGRWRKECHTAMAAWAATS
jgi:hypothetical protein